MKDHFRVEVITFSGSVLGSLLLGLLTQQGHSGSLGSPHGGDQVCPQAWGELESASVSHRASDNHSSG